MAVPITPHACRLGSSRLKAMDHQLPLQALACLAKVSGVGMA